jgi:hypothetical protein
LNSFDRELRATYSDLLLEEREELTFELYFRQIMLVNTFKWRRVSKIPVFVGMFLNLGSGRVSDFVSRLVGMFEVNLAKKMSSE